MQQKNKYPIFIPTKGRYDKNITARSFDLIGIDYKLVVEPQEYDNYASVFGDEKLLVTPHSNKGLTITRNWIWDYAKEQNFEKFWTFDDNIYHIYRLNNNKKIRCLDTTPLYIIEQFADRYENVPLIGMNYHSFCKQSDPIPPYYLNTRIYSNMLIKTDLNDVYGNPIRNQTYYNDDTDLCIRVMKNGYCIIQMNAFLIDKEVTMRHSGGMTDDYILDGRKKFAQELVDAHPDCVKLTQKFNRWHHHVDYRIFQNNKLIRKDIDIPDVVNNYGMYLRDLKDTEKLKIISKKAQ